MSNGAIALTVDLEEWHHGLGLPACSETVVQDTEWLLEAFSAHHVTATFFVLGDVAHRHPELIRRVADQGHEIAFHGANHVFLEHVTEADFRQELAHWIPRLEDLTGQSVAGYRAPYFSMTQTTSWALPILAEHGLKYDASIYPGLHDRTGWPGAPRSPVKLAHSNLVLFPVPVLPGLPVAFSGGAWLQLAPWPVIEWGLSRNGTGMVYVHPYEVTESPPKMVGAGLRGRVLRRLGRGKTRTRLRLLLQNYRERLLPMSTVVENLADLPTWSPS